MEKTIKNIVESHFGQNVNSIERLGGGYYGRVFLAKLEQEPYKVVVKLYLYPGLAESEAIQIQTLSVHSILKMPKIYNVYKADETNFLYDALLMEFLDGINAGNLDVSSISEDARTIICENIVDNLIAIHNDINEEGFGELTTRKFYPTWQDFYHPKAQKTIEKAKELLIAGQISEFVFHVFEFSFDRFDQIFYLPITEARLIHGDYNTWNIMLNREKNQAIFVIDPFGSCYADNEYDLYQLDNANGQSYGLLKRYAEKFTLSENFDVKRRFYKLYSEIGHYYDARVNVDLAAVTLMAKELLEVL